MYQERSVGHVFPIGFNDFVYFGLDTSVMSLMAKQNFVGLLEYGIRRDAMVEPNGVIERAQVNAKMLEAVDMPPEKYEPVGKSGRVWLRLQGRMVHMTAGLTLGHLHLAD